MKGDRLGEFEEFTLLAVKAVGDAAYGVPVQQFVERATGREVSMGAIYAALDRLEAKGCVASTFGEALPQRGGKPRRLFTVTPHGMRSLRELKRTRDRIWTLINEGRST